LGLSADLPCVIIFSGRGSPTSQLRSAAKICQIEHPKDVIPLAW